MAVERGRERMRVRIVAYRHAIGIVRQARDMLLPPAAARQGAFHRAVLAKADSASVDGETRGKRIVRERGGCSGVGFELAAPEPQTAGFIVAMPTMRVQAVGAVLPDGREPDRIPLVGGLPPVEVERERERPGDGQLLVVPCVADGVRVRPHRIAGRDEAVGAPDGEAADVGTVHVVEIGPVAEHVLKSLAAKMERRGRGDRHAAQRHRTGGVEVAAVRHRHRAGGLRLGTAVLHGEMHAAALHVHIERLRAHRERAVAGLHDPAGRPHRVRRAVERGVGIRRHVEERAVRPHVPEGHGREPFGRTRRVAAEAAAVEVVDGPARTPLVV